MPQLLRIFEQASFFGGSFGWIPTLGAGVFAAFRDSKVTKEQFAKPHTFITGLGSLSGTAKETEQSFITNGS
ncbi:MAG: hypothetical protein JXR26_06605 [Balneolaceae bacterium]|nr:hypothetical protein [Balneolaceae bacterium]